MNARVCLMILVVAVISLFGCAPSKQYIWFNPGSTEEESSRDRHSCRALADDYRTHFSKPRNRPLQNGQGTGDFEASRPDPTHEANVRGKAERLFEECMGAKGYELVKQNP